MISFIFGGTNNAPSNSAVRYISVVGDLSTTPSAAQNQSVVCPAAFTLGNFYVVLNAAPVGSGQFVFAVQKNNTDTAISVTISGSSTTGSYTSTGVSFAAGDTIAISCTPSNTPTTPTLIQWTLQADSGNSSHFGHVIGGSLGTTNLSQSAVTYSSLFGASTSASDWDASDANVNCICPTAGTIDKLYAVAATNPGGGTKAYALALAKNGSATSLSASIVGAATSANDTTHSISVVAGDTLSLAATPSNTPTKINFGWGFKFTPTIPGESFFGMGNSVAPSTTATQYNVPLGCFGSYSATESTRQLLIGGPCTLKAMYVAIGTAPNTGKSRTATIRRNSVSQPMTVTMSNAAISGNITGLNIGFVKTDLVSLQMAESGTPDADTGGVHLGVLVFVPTATISAGNFFSFMR